MTHHDKDPYPDRQEDAYLIYRFVDELRGHVFPMFTQSPGYNPFRAALDALRDEYRMDPPNWGHSSSADCQQLVAGGVPGDQIRAIIALCFPNYPNLKR